MYEARQGYAVVYINDVQMTKAKKQVEEIEKILLSEFELDEELIWTRANMKYKKDYCPCKVNPYCSSKFCWHCQTM